MQTTSLTGVAALAAAFFFRLAHKSDDDYDGRALRRARTQCRASPRTDDVFGAQRDLTPQEKKAIVDAVAPSLRNPAAAKYRWAKFPTVVTESSVNYCATVDAQSPFAAYSGQQAYIVEAHVSGGCHRRGDGPHRRRQGFRDRRHDVREVRSRSAKSELSQARSAFRPLSRGPFLSARAGERLHARFVGGEFARRT